MFHCLTAKSLLNHRAAICFLFFQHRPAGKLNEWNEPLARRSQLDEPSARRRERWRNPDFLIRLIRLIAPEGSMLLQISQVPVERWNG